MASSRREFLKWAAGAAVAVACGHSGAAPDAGEAPLGLNVQEGTLVKDGKPFRGIGVNYYDAFYRTLKNGKDRSYEDGFRVLGEKGIPFVRMMGCGFWPVDMKLYQDDQGEYFNRMDAVVGAAGKNGVGVIPSLFWRLSTAPDLAGEPCDQWGNPASKTMDFLRQYTSEVVGRYKNSPVIWGWEFGNEFNLEANLPSAAAHRPQVAVKMGTPPVRTQRDEMTDAMIRTAFAEFGREVRKLDPRRIISTGNAMPRASEWHQKQERSWTADTPEQFGEMLAWENPDPVSVISVHAYEDFERLPAAMEAARANGRPLFVGEFGAKGAAASDQFEKMLALIEKEKVPLAALWVFDFAGQNGVWSVTAGNDRSYQLEAICQAHARAAK